MKIFSAYSEAIAVKTRAGAPLDTFSIDRRAILAYNDAVTDDSVHALICFSCAMRYTHVKSFGAKNEIQWRKVLTGGRDVSCMNMDRQRCAEVYGLDVYIGRYGHRSGFPDMRQRMAEFEDWQMIVPFQRERLRFCAARRIVSAQASLCSSVCLARLSARSGVYS